MKRELTDRQREVLRLLGGRLTTREVAAKLGVSQAKVQNDVYLARAKLTGLIGRAVRTREQAIAVAREQGFIE